MDIQTVLNERQQTHGDYRDHAHVTQEIKDVIRNHAGWDKLSAIQRESLDMFAHKIGRILSGNPSFEDHWVDIAGYAQLIPNMQRLTADGK
jgi:hypothetical protein